MTQAPFGQIWAVSVALSALLLGKAGAQVPADSAAQVEQQQVELAAAGYIGAVLKSGRGPGFRGTPNVVFDERVGVPGLGGAAVMGRAKRPRGHATQLAAAFGTPLTDGDGTIACGTPSADGADGNAPGLCRFTDPLRGILRMSTPVVRNDSASVVVIMLRPGRGRMPIFSTTWDLRLVRIGGEWVASVKPYGTAVT